MIITRYNEHIIIAGQGFALVLGDEGQPALSILESLPEALEHLRAKKEEHDGQA